MYIAFKWLVVLALIMWLAMCMIDWYIKRNNMINMSYTGIPIIFFGSFRNETVKIKSQLTSVAAKPFTKQETIYLYNDKKYENAAGLHFLMFLAGALAVTAFRKNQEIITFAYRKMPTANFVFSQIGHCLKVAATKSSVAIAQYSRIYWEKLEMALYKIRNRVTGLKTRTAKHNKIHIILLKKLTELGEERKNLGQLLITAIRENKQIRMRYELETLTKNRLMQHIEDAQKQIKEIRSRYLSLQQLYLVTHQESNYLKARLVKLKQEKNETAEHLMGLINEVYKSKNNDLKNYCTRFLVKTKDNLLNSDVCGEIKEFLENSRNPSEVTLTPKVSDSLRSSSSIIRITELDNDDGSLVPLSDAPKLRGLPGEYVWTIKDKNGIIEKLYEYNYEPDLDSGDTIRRIRQYSVYYDKDCLLDFSKFQRGADTSGYSSRSNSRNVSNSSLSYHKIVTGSEVFQNFLRSCTNLVCSKPCRTPSLYYG